MPFETIYRCTDCGWEGNPNDHEDCPNDPMKDPEKRAEYEAWEAEYKHYTEVWEDWVDHNAPHIRHAYPSVDKEPDEVAVNGECVLHLPGDEESYTSSVLTNPTWGLVLIHFEQAIRITGDYHHSFLEGLIFPEEPQGEVAVVEFATGS